MRRREVLGFAAALAGAFAAQVSPARSELLTGKQIRVVVPFPAGGPTDIVARPFSQMLGEALKATIVVDNRGGAGGSIGASSDWP
jgi:tripartite-type tricarboxylate transporter receptor subunit TctC